MKKTKRMDRGGEVESRRGSGDDDRMERIRTRRGDAEGRRKLMMDKIEGYRSKNRGDFGSALAGAKARMKQNMMGKMRPQSLPSAQPAQPVVAAPPPNMPQLNSMPGAASQASPTQRAMMSGISSSPPARQSVVGSPPPNMGQMAQNVMSQIKSTNNPAAPKMRGGGLARKGVGQALKAGGAVRACGVAKRGKTKGKMV